MPKTKKVLPQRTPPSRFYRRVVLSFITLAFLLIILIVYFSVISVQILLTPKIKHEQRETIVEVVDGKRDDTELKKWTGTFFDRTFTSTSLTISTTGSAQVSEKKLFEVILKNKSQTNQSLVKTTRLVPIGLEGVLLRIDHDVVVPKGGDARVTVTMDEKSNQFFKEGHEISQDANFAIPGLSLARQQVVYGIAATAFSYATRSVPAVAEQDVSALENLLKKNIQEQKEQALAMDESYDPAKDMIIDKYETVKFDLEHKVGETAQSLTGSLMARTYGFLLNKEKTQHFVSQMLSDSLSKEKQLVSVVQESLKQSLENIDAVGRTGSLRVAIEGESTLRPEGAIFDKYQLIGFDKSQIVDYYSQFDGIEKVEVKMFPFWIERVPRQGDHVEIILEK